MEPVRPDYEGASIVGILPALIRGERPGWFPDPVRDAKQVVVLLLDGVGWTALQQHRSALPTLAGMEGRAITSVVPSTTATALTSVATGLTPAEHGIVGFRVRIDTRVLNVLRWTMADKSEPPDPVSFQPAQAFEGIQLPVVTRAEFSGTGFTQAHMRGAKLIGWRATSTLVEHCRRLVASGEPVIYAYYDGPDLVAHRYGLDDFYLAELRAADRLVGDLLEAMPSGTALLVFSDHGQVEVGAKGWVGIEPLQPMVAAYGGEGRFRYLYAKPGREHQLLAAAEELLGERSWIFSKEQLVSEGWLGGTPAPPVLHRLGDVVVAPRDPISIVDPTNPREVRLVTGHGGLTPDEMLVPLLGARAY